MSRPAGASLCPLLLLGVLGLCACRHSEATGDSTGGASVTPDTAPQRFRLVADRSEARFAWLPTAVTLTRIRAFSHVDPRFEVEVAEPTHAPNGGQVVWYEQVDGARVLAWPDYDSATTITLRPDGSGAWVGTATFTDWDGSTVSSAHPVRLERE